MVQFSGPSSKVKSVAGEIDRDIERYNGVARSRILSKPRKIFQVFLGNLKLSGVEGDFHPAIDTQDLIIKCEFSERYFEFMSTV